MDLTATEKETYSGADEALPFPTRTIAPGSAKTALGTVMNAVNRTHLDRDFIVGILQKSLWTPRTLALRCQTTSKILAKKLKSHPSRKIPDPANALYGRF
jgi:hypothetical protein